MDNLTAIVSCPYCMHGNEIYVDDYDGYDWEDLKDLCELCGNQYLFVIEINYKTRSFKL